MARAKLRVEEGWASVLLLALMLLSVVWSVRAAQWVDGLSILQWIALPAIVVTLVATQARRVPGIAAHFLLLLMGAAWVTWMLSLVFGPPAIPASLVPPGTALAARIGIMFQEMQRWLLDPVSAENWLSNFMFLANVAILTWLLCCWSTWFVFRSHWVWGAVIPAGAACLLNVYYGPPQLLIYLILYLFFSLLLLVRMHVYLRQTQWRRSAVNYNIDVDFAFLRDGLLVSALVLAIAWTLPAAARSSRLADFWSRFQDPWSEIQARWTRLFTSLNYQGPSTLVEFGRTMTLGGAVNLSNVPVLEVQTSTPRYLRAVVYDRYTGSGWVNTDELEVTLQPNDPRLVPSPWAAQRELNYTVRMLEQGEDTVLIVGQMVSTSLFTRVRLATIPLPEGRQATEVSMVQSLRTLRRNESYNVTALISTATANQLRNAGTDYPEWVRIRYLEIPRRVPARVRDLARDIAREASTPYDQAIALQSYLRRITYDQYISPPPAGRDVVDWFLFENRRGYCDYYATAMAVMCRALGIPARVSQGYASGEYVPASRSYLVRQSDAHAWPEVYFPGYGWIEFEPTSSQPALSRPEEDEPTVSRAAGTTLPQLEEDEDKFGPDEMTGEEGEAADVTLPQYPTWPRRLLYPAFAVSGALLAAILAILVWWYSGLYGLSPAIRIYEQMQRLGRLLGVMHQAHETPTEYGESLIRVLPQNRADIRYVVDQYVRQRFGKQELATSQEQELQERWQRLRWQMWRQALRRLGRRRAPHTSAWVPASSLRPPTSLG